MRKFVLQSMPIVIGIGLLGATTALADPVTVTSGHVTALETGGTFSFRGDGLSLTGNPTVPGYVSSFWECSPCRPGDGLTFSLSSTAGGTFDSGREGEFDHIYYGETWLAGNLVFTAGDITSAILGTGQTSISLPFTFTGEILNYESYASRVTPGSAPLFVATLVGSGIATAHFRGPVADPDGALFFADHITYDFTSAAPTPEPSSLFLLGTGAAALLARRRIRD